MKKKKINLTYLPILLGIVFGFGVAFFIDEFFALKGLFEGGFVEIIILLIELYLAIFFQVVLHELGHLVFGLLTGYKFLSYRVGNFMIVKQNNCLKIKKMSLAGTSGQCLMSPPDFNNGKMPFLLYNLGGVFFNAVFSFIFLFLYLIVDVFYLKVFGIIMAIIGLFYAFVNGVPLGLAVNNDGYNVLLLLKNKESIRSFWLQMKINEQLANGLRLKDISDEFFKLPKSDANDSMINAIRVFACNRLLDEKKFLEAYEEMDKLLDGNFKIVDIHRYLLILDCIYCELILKKKDKYIQMYRNNELQRFIMSMKNYPSVLRTMYAYTLLKEGNGVKASDIKVRFTKISSNYPYKSDIDSELELIRLIEINN